jgi:hypothetical protein
MSPVSENQSFMPPGCHHDDHSCPRPERCDQLLTDLLQKIARLTGIVEAGFDTKIHLEEELLAALETLGTAVTDRLDSLESLLETKVSLENRIIAILVQILNALGGNPGCSSSCSVNGTASGPTPPSSGTLTVQICNDCVLLPASVDYDVINPQNKSVRRVTSTSITSPPTCTLDGSGTGTITITGTADVRVGVNGTVQQGPFTLTLTVVAFQVTQFRVQAPTVDDTITPSISNNIVVAKCP